MTKVSLPLGSAAAFGKFGSMLVFQGNWVRSYVTPYDPKTPAQVAVREVFRDITKQEAQFGLWAKNALRTVVGSRWYTGLYKRVTENSYERFGDAVDLWNAFTTEQQDAWDSAALFQETTIRPGLAFFAVMYCVKDWLTLSNAPDYGLGNVNGGSSASTKTWATKSLDGAFTSGTYDDDDALLQYLGSWTDIADGSTFGGSYKQSDASGSPSVSFYFYGTQLFLNYLKKTGAGGLQVSSYAFGTEVISQNNSMTLYGQMWTSRGAIRGLHYVTLTRTGAGAVNIDKIMIGNKTNPTADFLARAEVSEVPSVCLTLEDPWSAPGGNSLWAVYWDRELWDVGGMHDAPDLPYQIRTLVSGRYDMYCEILFEPTNETWTGELFVYVNSQIVAHDINRLAVGIPSSMRLSVGKRINLNVGDMLTVFIKTSRTVSTPLAILPDYAPLFQLELTQRTSLMVETMNVTQNIGTDHGAMSGLDDDDHSQYLTEERGDNRYPLLNVFESHGDQHEWLGADALNIRDLFMNAFPAVFKDWRDLVGFLASHTGSATFTNGIMFGVASTGGTSGSRCCLYSGNTFAMVGSAGLLARMRARINPSTGLNNSVIWIGNMTNPTAPTATEHHAAFKIVNGAVYASTGNGSGGNLVDLGLSVAQYSVFDFYIKELSTGVLFYVNGVLKATITTNKPNSGYLLPTFFLQNTAAASVSIALFPYWFMQGS